MLYSLLAVSIIGSIVFSAEDDDSHDHDHDHDSDCNYWWPVNSTWPLAADKCQNGWVVTGKAGDVGISFMLECDHDHVAKFESADCSGEEVDVEMEGTEYCDGETCSGHLAEDCDNEVEYTVAHDGCYHNSDLTKVAEITGCGTVENDEGEDVDQVDVIWFWPGRGIAAFPDDGNELCENIEHALEDGTDANIYNATEVGGSLGGGEHCDHAEEDGEVEVTCDSIIWNPSFISFICLLVLAVSFI